MAWRLHLTNQAIPHLDILDQEPPRLAVWARHNRVVYYDLMTGTTIEEQIIIPPESNDRRSEEWQTFLRQLATPGGDYLPRVKVPKLTILTTGDGRMRLYDAGSAALILDRDGNELALETAEATCFVALALDHELGHSVALDRGGRLFIYQQHMLVGAFDVGLSLEVDLWPSVAISRGGESVFVTDGQTIVSTNSRGAVQKRVDTDHCVRLIACSPDGSYLSTCDMDAGVIRIFRGNDLALAYQRFAVDLVAEATQVQLMANLPPTSVVPSALTINDDGVLAFAMSGVVCVTDLSHLDKILRP